MKWKSDDGRRLSGNFYFKDLMLPNVLNEFTVVQPEAIFESWRLERRLESGFIAAMQKRMLKSDTNPVMRVHLVRGQRDKLIGNCIGAT